MTFLYIARRISSAGHTLGVCQGGSIEHEMQPQSRDGPSSGHCAQMCTPQYSKELCTHTFGKEISTVMFDTNGGPISGGLTIGQLAAKLLQICSPSSWMTLCQSRARTIWLQSLKRNPMQCTMTHMFHMSLMSHASSGACEQSKIILSVTILGPLLRVHPDRLI